MFDRLIASNFKGEVDKDTLVETLKDDVDNYNKHILNILSTENSPTRKSNSVHISNFLDKNFLKELVETKEAEMKSPFRNKYSVSPKTLEFFYSIENCPSYIEYKKCLNREDIRAFIKIYCELNCLDLNVSDDVVEYVYEIMREEIKRKTQNK